MKRTILILTAGALTLALVVPATASAQSGTTCRTKACLVRENAALKRTNAALRARVKTLTGERDTARSQVPAN
jgi:cell division protein FtsB